MRFLSLEISNFRNISFAQINTDAKDIVLTGINGQGKTNLLEAIYMLCYGSSFRTSITKDCIRHNSDGFCISGSFLNDFGEKEKVNIVYKDNKRKIIIDSKEIKDRKELIYKFPCIVFCHEDINYIKGEPEERRRFFDQMMSLYSPVFFDNLRQYKTILSQRNAAIKNGQYDLLTLYNGRLAYFGLEIIKSRTSAVYDFNNIFPELFEKISSTDLNLCIEYIPSWSDFATDEEIVGYLESTLERDIKMGTTTSGIHRDRFIVKSQYGPFSSIGSTGQLRLCSLIFRIAEAKYYTKCSGKKPILLLDDVLLELDPEKRGKILGTLDDYSQAFYTFLPFEKYFEEINQEICYSVEEGKFINEDK